MARTQYSEDFQAFWRVWPGRWREEGRPIKTGKSEAYEYWQGKSKCHNGTTIDDEDREDLCKVVLQNNFRHSSKQYLKDLCRWLKWRRWEDYI